MSDRRQSKIHRMVGSLHGDLSGISFDVAVWDRLIRNTKAGCGVAFNAMQYAKKKGSVCLVSGGEYHYFLEGGEEVLLPRMDSDIRTRLLDNYPTKINPHDVVYAMAGYILQQRDENAAVAMFNDAVGFVI